MPRFSQIVAPPCASGPTVTQCSAAGPYKLDLLIAPRRGIGERLALFLGGLRRRIEALLMPDEVDVILQLDGLAERERHRRLAAPTTPVRLFADGPG